MKPVLIIAACLVAFSVPFFTIDMRVAAQTGQVDGTDLKPGEVKHGLMVPMRDGVRLAIDIYRPSDAVKVPAILVMTPYDRTPDDHYPWGPAQARKFTERGYAFIVADVRGRYQSEGSWDAFNSLHRTDGYDLVEWAARQTWSDGKVAMWGPSFLGQIQWWTASTAPPHLVAIVPLNSPADGFDGQPYMNGVLAGGYWPDWNAVMSGRTRQIIGPGPYGGWTARRLSDYSHTPYQDIDRYRGFTNVPWVLKSYQQNKTTDPYWAAISYQNIPTYRAIRVPSLSVTGWFDVNHGAPVSFIGMKRYGATPAARKPTLIIGPWTHFKFGRELAGIDYGPDAAFDIDGYTLKWLDYHVKGISNGIADDPPVHLFVMGEDKWRMASDWPLPEAKPVRYYFDSAGHANSSRGDGVLSPALPRSSEFDHYTYDPHKPTLDPSVDIRDTNGHLDGAVDTRKSALSPDVLVYQTPPLDTPTTVIGPIEVTLFASTSARDTDWMARLVDVDPDGRSLLLADGALRARNGDPSRDGRFNGAKLSRIVPNHIYQYTIEFWRGTANRFQCGHRIRVEISSSWYPFFLPNLNTGSDNLSADLMSQAVVAKQQIFHSKQYASFITLPIAPPDTSLEKCPKSSN